ncbi:MAG: AP2 domain-containing protein [Planctomycetota bacterium]|jgi:hypothetical protein
MPQTSQETKCPACYFSRRMGGRLHCLKNPPVLNKRTGCARWPTVKKTDICGSFRFADGRHIHTDPDPKSDLPIHTDRFGQYCKIPLTQGKFAKVDPDDYPWLAQFRWHCKTNKNAAYAARTVTHARRPIRIYMHRLIARTPPHLFCDHVNHNGLDNRKANLRSCTLSQNNANARPAKNASSIYKGVSFNKRRKKWAASIKSKGKQQHLGYFDSEIDAAKAYDERAKELFGRFANLNFAE